MDTLKKVFAAVLGIDPKTITPETAPTNTATWDSLNAIVLVSEIEKAFNVKFTYDEVMRVKDFADVVRVVESKGISLK